MVKPIPLSAEDFGSFQESGFIGPIKLYEPDEAKCLLETIRMKNWDRSHVLHDNDVNYDRHFDISELARHVGHPVIVGAIRSLIGPDVLCWRTEFFPKFPGSAGTEWHQVKNYQYATGTPQLQPTDGNTDRPIDLTVWTAFTEATKENGCMKFMPGSHRRLYFDESKVPTRGRGEAYETLKSDTSFFGYNFSDFKVDPDWEPDECQAVAMEMNPGECVIFTAMCMHGSYPNTSERSTRFAISARYVPTHVRVYPDQDEFMAHGAHFDLREYGCVLVSGQDGFGHNRIRRANNLGEPFPFLVP